MSISNAKGRLDPQQGDPPTQYVTAARIKQSYDDLQAAWQAETTSSLPAGGAVGQMLTKQSATNFDADWSDTRRVFVQSTAPAGGSGQQVGDLFVLADVGGSAAGFLPALESGEVIRTVTPGQSIQAAINQGPGWVFLAPGTHNVTAPIEMAKNVRLSGAGPATILNATSAISSVIHVGNEIVRWVVDHMQIQCNALAQIGVDVATDFAGSSVESEPDCMGRMDLLWIYDAANIGVRHLGGVDVQNCYTSRVRVRRAENYAFWNEGADNSFLFCDGTTNSATGAGFYAGGANSHYTSCKAWYCRNYGWHTASTRSMFIGCGSQDTKNHGWYIEYDKSTYVGCIADSAAYGDVGGVLNGADGFYVVSTGILMVGCMSFDRMQGYPAQQRYGFNLPTAMSSYIDAAKPGLGAKATSLHGWNNVSGLFNWR